MAVKTKIQLLSDIATGIPDNNAGAVTPAVVRAILGDIVDTLKVQNNLVEFEYKGTSFGLLPGYFEKTIDVNAAATVNLPDGYDKGWWCVVANVGTGSIDWTGSNPVQVVGTKADVQYTSFLVLCTGLNQWRVEGRTS